MVKTLEWLGALIGLLLTFLMLGFISLATYEAASTWGIQEAYFEITSSAWNISVFIGCWLFGLLALCGATSLIASLRQS